MMVRGALLLLLGVLLAPGLALGGSISISIAPTVEIREGKVIANMKISNSGDEAAHGVAPVFRFRDQEARMPARESLAPNETMQAQLGLPADGLGEGRWPYRVAVDYADANQYPFQALHIGTLVQGTPPPAKVGVTGVDAQPLSGSGSVSVRVKNLSATPRDVSVTVVMPEGVEVTEPARRLSLGAWEETSFSSPLVNRTALAGSRYPIFVTAEYDDDNMHQVVLGHGTLEVTNARSFFQSQRSLLWIVAGVLVAAWLAFLARQLASGRLRRATPPRS